MTIDEAIEHAEWVAENTHFEHGDERCNECSEEHRQLARWLRELRSLRAHLDTVESQCDELGDENERLRGLVREMSIPYKYGDFDCGLCPHTDKCWDSETLDFNPDGCAILQMVRELGFEVDA